MPDDGKSGDWLERAVKMGTLALGATYATGFVIVNAYYAQFGVTDFSFIKARILAAGLLLFALGGLGTLIAAGIFGVGEVQQATVQLGDKPDGIQMLIRIAFYYSATSLVSIPIVRIILIPEVSAPRHVWADVLVALSGVCGLLVGLLRDRAQKYALAAAALSSVGLFTGLIVGDKTRFWVNTWLVLTGVMAVLFYNKMRRNSANWKLLWDGGSLLLLLAVGFFSRRIYGHVAPYFGGGHPNEITCYLSADAPKPLGAGQFHGWLLDQDDHGYYVLRSLKDQKALYLTRDIVKAVEFKASDSEAFAF